MPGQLYPQSRIEKRKKKGALQGPLCLPFRANPSPRARIHSGGEKAQPSLAGGESRGTYRSSGRSWQEATVLPVSLCGYSRRPQTHKKTSRLCNSMPLPSVRVSHGSSSPTPTSPDPAASRWVICSWTRHCPLTAACLQAKPSQRRIRGKSLGVQTQRLTVKMNQE